jgi:phage-related protein
MKSIVWVGTARKDYAKFPVPAQQVMGRELLLLQLGGQPHDFKPMPSVGAGVEEIRIWVESGTYRVIYIARRAEAVYVLHAFQKKSQKTSRNDLELARKRLSEVS